MNRGYTAASSTEKTSLVSRTRNDAQIQNVPSARVYVFGDADVTEEESNVEMTELRVRGANSTSYKTLEAVEPVYLEKAIGEGDTLQNVALKFGCPISELKRINNLISDQDFYALSIIKVPVKRHGLLTELIAQENNKANGKKIKLGASNCTDTLEIGVVEEEELNNEELSWDSSDNESKALLVRTLSIRGAMGNQGKEAKQFLKKMDQDLQKIRNSTKSTKDSLEEVTSTLTSTSIHPLTPQIQGWGPLSAKSVIGILVLVIIIVPTMFLVFYLIHIHQFEHNT